MADVWDDAMLAPTGELRCHRFPVRCRDDTIRVPVQRDRRHSDGRLRGEGYGFFRRSFPNRKS